MFDKMIMEMKTLSLIKKNELDCKLTKKFTFEQIEKLAKTVNEKNINSTVYKNGFNIQSEIIENDDFVDFFINRMPVSEKISGFMDKIIDLLRRKEKKITDYSYELFIKLYDLCYNAYTLSDDVYIVFLEKSKNEDLNNVSLIGSIFNNICYFYGIKRNLECTLEDMSNDAFDVFKEEFVSSYFPENRKQIKEMCTILSKNKALKALIKKLHEEGKGTEFSISSFNVMSDTNVADKIHKISESCKEAKHMQNFFVYWKQDNYSKKELYALEKYCATESKENVANALSTRIKYLNVIYGNKYPFISKLNRSNVHTAKEELYIYAIVEKKRAFLKLLEKNRELFESISYKSLLYSENFRKHVNINALNTQNIEDIKDMFEEKKLSPLWSSGRMFTFNEIKALCTCENKYIRFYLMLENMRIDDKLLILRQVKKHELVDICGLKQENLEILARKLSEKSIYSWMESEFSHIKSLEVTQAAGLLLIYDEKKELIKNIANSTEAEFIINNSESELIKGIVDMNYLKDNLLEIDRSWLKLKDMLKIGDDYIAENKKGIIDFCMRNGAYMAYTFYNENITDDSQKKAFFRIIKSVISGKFYKLKYHAEDLSAEMQFEVSKIQKDIWIKNNSTNVGNNSILEADDFYSTMNIGEMPIRTCISYKSGMYAEYLISNFDSNKKIINVFLGEKIVGRSILRFTKCRYNYEKKKTSLEFIDVENDEDTNNITFKSIKNEFLVIFLERGYFAGINKAFEIEMRKKIIHHVEKKAINMGVVPAFSEDYNIALIDSDKYISQNLDMFISHSKAGKQYLDSLGGKTSISDEGKYYSGRFILPVNI
ncbi:MAG: hypothetical protein IJ583_17100 [Firmicutes bacterium]|nr:hypothetical protein [Bacillota bacterium]